MDTDNTTDHIRDDDHVTEMGLDNSGLVFTSGFSLGLADTIDQGHRLALKTTDYTATSTAMNKFDEL